MTESHGQRSQLEQGWDSSGVRTPLPSKAQALPCTPPERQHRSSGNSSRLGALVNPMRGLPRQDEVRIAKYWRFPRERSDQLPRIGFTRDVSLLGMCLGVDHAEPVGVLLRVDLRSLDGESMGASIARVAWCKDACNGRQWLGLDLLCDIGRLGREANLV